MCAGVPVLVVDPGAVEQGGEEVLAGTQTVQDHQDAVHGGQQKHRQGEQEAAVVSLSNTAVYPTVRRGQMDTASHTCTQQNTRQPPVNFNPDLVCCFYIDMLMDANRYVLIVLCNTIDLVLYCKTKYNLAGYGKLVG